MASRRKIFCRIDKESKESKIKDNRRKRLYPERLNGSMAECDVKGRHRNVILQHDIAVLETDVRKLYGRTETELPGASRIYRKEHGRLSR